jgi:hypothetical protein
MKKLFIKLSGGAAEPKNPGNTAELLPSSCIIT